MRIVIHGINYAPELTGVGKYTGELAESLAAQGHNVRVVTAPPYYPHWKVGSGYSAWGYRRETIAGVDVWRCPVWVPAEPSGLKRILHLASFAIASLPVMLRQVFWKPEMVLVLEPTFACVPQALLTARLSRSQSWLHIQDFEVDAALDLGILKAAPTRKVLHGIESWLMKKFDRVSTISKSMLRKAEEKGVLPENLFLLPNWVDTDRVQHDPTAAKAFRLAHGIADEETMVLYSGNMGEKQGLEGVLEVAETIESRVQSLESGAGSRATGVESQESRVGSRATGVESQESRVGSLTSGVIAPDFGLGTRDSSLPSFVFFLCGAGAARRKLEAEVAQMQLSSIRFLPLQPDDAFVGMMSAADIHLVVQRTGAADLVMPSKLTGILSVGGVPIVTAEPGTELFEVTTENRFGLVIPPENTEALVQALMTLATDAGLRATYKERARAYALHNLSRDRMLTRLI